MRAAPFKPFSADSVGFFLANNKFHLLHGQVWLISLARGYLKRANATLTRSFRQRQLCLHR